MNKQMTAKDLTKDREVSVTIKLRDIVNSNEPLKRLAGEKFPVVLSYKISKTMKILDDIIETFSKKRKEVLSRLGTLNAKEGTYTFEGENEQVATDELEKMLDEEVVVSILKVTLSELEGHQIEPRIFAILDWYVIAE